MSRSYCDIRVVSWSLELFFGIKGWFDFSEGDGVEIELVWGYVEFLDRFSRCVGGFGVEGEVEKVERV